MKILLLDNYDSFTYMLKDYIEQCGVSCFVYRNDELNENEFLQLKFDALVISPGPQKPQNAGLLLKCIDLFYLSKPILGVCLGHQALGEFFGAELVKAKLPRHGKVDSIEHTHSELFSTVSNLFNATRYHSLILQNLPECIVPIAFCKNEIMAIQHRSLPLYGIQFHPESCQSEAGLQIISNFVSISKEFNRT